MTQDVSMTPTVQPSKFEQAVIRAMPNFLVNPDGSIELNASGLDIDRQYSMQIEQALAAYNGTRVPTSELATTASAPQSGDALWCFKLKDAAEGYSIGAALISVGVVTSIAAIALIFETAGFAIPLAAAAVIVALGCLYVGGKILHDVYFFGPTNVCLFDSPNSLTFSRD